MRDDKYEKLLNASIVLLIVSSIILVISTYKYFIKTSNVIKPKLIGNAPSKKIAERDSLQKIYTSTLNDIDNNLKLDAQLAADKDAQIKLADVNTLRTEIAALLKDQTSDANLANAKLKIEELQLKVAILQNRFTGVEWENRRLQALLQKLMSANKNNSVSTNTPTFSEKPTISEEQPTNNLVATTSVGLHLFAVANNNNKEQETDAADEAEKIIGTFSLKNISKNANPEVMVVVLQPDGKVVKNSAWESGIFETKEGKKVYSHKISFERSVDEKQLNFSLSPDNFIKGDYILQVWYNGKMIGKTIKTLS
jgi:hypothetical protein